MGVAEREYMKAPAWQDAQRKRLTEWKPQPWRPPRRRRNRALVIVVAAVLTAAGGGVGYAIGAEVGPFAPPPALVWGGKGFSDKAEFKRWLESRGASYKAWARKHPAAAARLERP
jgi:hypothetical protein